MQRNTILDRWARALPLILGLGCLPALASAGPGGGQQPAPPGPSLPNPQIYVSTDAEYWGLSSSSSAWRLECENAPEVVLGDLIVNAVEELDDLRCYRVVDGNVEFKGGDSLFDDVDFVSLPWLERITGDLIVNAKANLDEVWLPRLTTLDGALDADFRQMLEKVALPQMMALGDVHIDLRSMSNDWTGLDSVTTMGHLSIANVQVDDPMTFGLAGLVSVDSLEIEGNGVTVIYPGVMMSLTTVHGNVTVKATDESVYGTSQIQTIGGNLYFTDTTLEDFSNFSSLLSVAGCIEFSNAPELSQVERNALFVQVGQGNAPNNCL